jgi:tRNA(fMet)-specific endonuclease VapC
MKYLVDTDWLAEYLKGRNEALHLLNALEPDGIGISLITFGEIYEGIYYGQNPRSHEEGFKDFLRRVAVVQLSQAIMKRFARIRGQLRREGNLASDPDLLIAATAIHHNLVLVTRNRKHFERIRELKLYSS